MNDKTTINQPCLFSEEEMEAFRSNEHLIGKSTLHNTSTTRDIFNRHILEELSYTSTYQMPKVKAVSIEVPRRLIGYDRLARGAVSRKAPGP